MSSSKIDLYDSQHRPKCTMCGDPATYWVFIAFWSSYYGASRRYKDSTQDWGCPQICRSCALVNEANAIGERHRDSTIRYPFTKQQHHGGRGFTVYKLLNWPNKARTVPAKPEHRWPPEECARRKWPCAEVAYDEPHPEDPDFEGKVIDRTGLGSDGPPRACSRSVPPGEGRNGGPNE